MTTVYVKTYRGTKKTKYHTDQDCKMLPEESDPWKVSKSEAEDRGLTECSFCAGTVDYSAGSGNTGLRAALRSDYDVGVNDKKHGP